MSALMFPRACRVCGCTDDRACVTDDGPCWWVDEDLCSACPAHRPRRALSALVLFSTVLVLITIVAVATWIRSKVAS